jgi:hypothetical protein
MLWLLSLALLPLTHARARLVRSHVEPAPLIARLLHVLPAAPLQLPGGSIANQASRARSATALRAAPAVLAEAGDGDIPENLPDPSKLADAWNRDASATELVEKLKGCSITVGGVGARKTAVGRAIARRLKYRFYDVGALLLSTYRAISGKPDISLAEVLEAEPLEDIEQLASAVLSQVEGNVRAVFAAWDGGVDQASYAQMQQGLVVNLDFGDKTEDNPVALPKEGAEETRTRWTEGWGSADLTVDVAEGAADDAAAEVIKDLLKFIADNPAQSEEWKAEADRKLAEQGEQ